MKKSQTRDSEVLPRTVLRTHTLWTASCVPLVREILLTIFWIYYVNLTLDIHKLCNFKLPKFQVSDYSFYFIDHLIHFYKNQPNKKSFNVNFLVENDNILFNNEQINSE